MVRLEDTIDPAKHRARLVPGYASENGMISIGGLFQPAIWLTHVRVQPGDPIQILIVDRPDAPSTAVVLGGAGKFEEAISEPREGVVDTAPTGAETIGVSTTAGIVSATILASYTPVVSDRVRLLWQNGVATVLGKVGVTPAPPPKGDSPPAVNPPPSGKSDGSDVFTASDSATWSTGTGSWNSYFGRDLYQGSYGSTGANRGAWFYHGKPGKLAGKTVTSVEIWVPKRVRAGSYNSSVTLNLYLHSSKRRPGGDVDRGAGTSLSIPKGFDGDWKSLPLSWADDLIGGDGIGMAGGSYAGFEGIRKSPQSGQLRINWRA